MSAKALCSPQEAIRSKQLPFWQFNGTIVSEAYQIDLPPEIPIGNKIEMVFFIITKLNFSQSGYISFYFCFLFIKLTCIAH